MNRIHNIIRKIRILAGFIIVRKIVSEYYPDGRPKTIIRYRGEGRFIREVSKRNL